MNQTGENGKKPSFGLNFGSFGPNSGCQFFFQKSGSVSHWILWLAIIIYNIKKTNDPILRKLSDGRMDRRTRVIS